MENNWAADHLQTIRTLMERSALYRRALAPIMLLTGGVGVFAAVAGWRGGIELPRSFAEYWLVVAFVTVAAAFVMVRLQAFKDKEPFWSPPTRRVAKALLPALTAGFLLTAAASFGATSPKFETGTTFYAKHLIGFVWLPAAWIVLYGCALHAAGFFMPRGMRLFGWLFILGGCSLFWVTFKELPTYRVGHTLMGLFFGVCHLAYGGYLYFTEQTRNAA